MGDSKTKIILNHLSQNSIFNYSKLEMQKINISTIQTRFLNIVKLIKSKDMIILFRLFMLFTLTSIDQK